MADDTLTAKAKAPVLKAVPDAPAETGEGEQAAALRKKELIDRVGTIAKAKKKDVRDVVEATLIVLGEALARGEELILPPLGRAKVARQKGVNGGDLYVIKLRRGGNKPAEGEETDADA